jgi:hypothetical protein
LFSLPGMGKTGSPSFLINLFESSDSIVSRLPPNQNPSGPLSLPGRTFIHLQQRLIRYHEIVVHPSGHFPNLLRHRPGWRGLSGVIGTLWGIAGANYSEYGPASRSLWPKLPVGGTRRRIRRTSSTFLEEEYKGPRANYSHYSPASTSYEHERWKEDGRFDIPENLRWFLNDTPESFRTNLQPLSPRLRRFHEMSGKKAAEPLIVPRGSQPVLSR